MGASQLVEFYHVNEQEEMTSFIDFQSASWFLYRVLLFSDFQCIFSMEIYILSRLSELQHFSTNA